MAMGFKVAGHHSGFLDGNSSACQSLCMSRKITQLGKSVALPA
jgi:hypothetical protein